MTAGTPFAMLAHALRRAAAIVDYEPVAVGHRKLRARVLRNVAARDVDHVTEFLAELLGVLPAGEPSVLMRAARHDPQLMADQTQRAWQTVLAAECAAGPVVLVLEDLHWCERATVQFIDAAVRQLAERPLFVLALARPEVAAVFPRLWAARRVARLQLREGDEPARAAPGYRRAAQQAREGIDLASAIDCAERAIACVDAVEESDPVRDRELVGVLRQLQAGAHVRRGEYALATERGNQALELLSPSSVPWLVAAAAVADACSRRLEHARVLELCRTLAATEVTPPLHHAFAHAVATTMTTLLWHGDAALTEQLFAQLARIETTDPATLAWIYYARAWRALHDGAQAESLALDLQ